MAAITKAGGTVKYDWEWSDGFGTPGGKPWAANWLVDLTGLDYFSHVAHVTFTEPPNDATIVRVGRSRACND